MTAAALLWSGCGAIPASSCDPLASPPVTLSGDDRRDPAVATDGGAGGVVAWESLSGGPVEAALRRPGGGWGAAEALSADAARDPQVAMDPSGAAAVVWQRQPVGGDEAIEVATRARDGAWSAPAAISDPRTRAREPQIGADAHGTLIAVWRRDAGGANGVVEVAERPAAGAWSAPRAVSAGDARIRRPRLAVAPEGSAVVTWERRGGGRREVVAATRGPDGTWSTGQVVSGPVVKSDEPDAAIGLTGDATIVWLGSDGDRTGVYVVERTRADGWSAPRSIGHGAGRPREVSRPGRAESGADVTAMPDGGAVAIWTVHTDGGERVQVAARRGGVWSAPEPLSRATVAGGAQIAGVAGGSALAAWEEIDNGLLRARIARVEPGGPPGSCRDLSRARSETAGVRLAGGAAPIVAFTDLNRTRIEAVDVR